MELNHKLALAEGTDLKDGERYRCLVGRLIYLAVTCDSDWASCPLTRRSLAGWFVLLSLSPVSWKTKEQHTVSRSSTEAEYRSIATLTCELKWLQQILRDLGVEHKQSMRVFCDSHAVGSVTQNPVFHKRTKHVEADCHFLRDAIKK
ncbi:unnamed protein product [Rhodiola kirilowii]